MDVTHMCHLIDQIVGPSALILETLTEAQVAAQATATLRSVLGTANVPEPIGCSFSRWAGDAFARGSYTHIQHKGKRPHVASPSVASITSSVASITSSVASIQNKEGNYSSNGSNVTGDSTRYGSGSSSSITNILVDRCVHYAGEANYRDYRGTVHGAYISGTEAAHRIIAIERGDE